MKFLNQFNAFLAGEVNLSQPRLDQLDERVGAIDSFLRTGDDEIASRFVQTIPRVRTRIARSSTPWTTTTSLTPTSCLS